MNLYLNDFIRSILHFNQQITILNWKDEVVFQGTPLDFALEENELYSIEGNTSVINCVYAKDDTIIIEL